jgi:glycosyltransferase involved in cell wall biosynthesis
MKVEYALRHCDAVIATSVFTKNRILFHYPDTSVPIHVVYQPIHPLFKSTEANPSSVGQPYFIYHSGFNKRKNHLRLLEAFKSVQQSISQSLLLVGVKGDTYDEVSSWVIRNQMTDRVTLKTDVETTELVELLGQSDGFIYPSMMEGFGIPLAEAAALGLNAAVSDIPVFNELSSGGFITFNPTQTESIAHALIRLAALDVSGKNQQQAARTKLVELTNSETIAKQLMAIYKEEHPDAT